MTGAPTSPLTTFKRYFNLFPFFVSATLFQNFDMFHVFTEASPKNFYPGVNPEFAGRPPPVDGTWKNSEIFTLYMGGNMTKYVGNMKEI